MAKCKSLLMSVIRGSIGGITYTSNTFCSIIARSRTIPTNTNTQRQQQIRACFTQAKAIWPTLTRSIRAAWEQWAQTVTLQGPTGPYTVPGRQWYQGIRGTAYYLALRGVSFGTLSNNAPTTHGLISPGVWAVAVPTTGNGYKITFSPITLELLTYFTFRSTPQTDDKNYFSGPFDTETMLSMSQTLIADPVILERTDLVLGAVYFERIRVISHQGPLRVSEQLIIRLTATAHAGNGQEIKATVITRRALPKAA